MGGAGSGKTTLAAWLSDQLEIPCTHLDQVAWNKAGKVPLNDRMTALDEILARPAWVTEGAFLWWTDPLLENADVIIYLDMPFPLNAWRMVKRHVLASWRGNNPHPSVLNLLDFMIGVGQKYYRKEPLVPRAVDDDFSITRVGTLDVLSAHTDKLIHCKSPKDVANFQKSIIEGK